MKILFSILFVYICSVYYLSYMQRNYNLASGENAFTSSEISDRPFSKEATLFNVMETMIIKDHPNYLITSNGDVYSLNYNNTKETRKLKPCLTTKKEGKGYFQVDLHKKDKRNTNLIHRLVAQAFIPNPENLPQVNHKDRIKIHNWVGNLEWCTNQYNIAYEYKCGKIKHKGEQSSHHKLTNEDVFKIRELGASNTCNKSKIGREFGISSNQVDYIIKRKSWKHI